MNTLIVELTVPHFKTTFKVPNTKWFTYTLYYKRLTIG